MNILSGLGFGVHGIGRSDIHDAHRYSIARLNVAFSSEYLRSFVWTYDTCRLTPIFSESVT